MIQGCFKGVYRVFEGASRVFQGNFDGVLRVFRVCVLRVFQ